MRKIYLVCCVIFYTSIINAQVTGIKTIGVDYPTIAAAVTDLNTLGVGTGGATINVPAGYTENAPVGGYLLGSATLNASLSAANSLVIQKSGSGANPIITAQVGTTTNLDGIFTFQGVDYTTIDGINLKENAANITTPSTMEWGYGFVNFSSTDGCQNNTVKNCTITMQKVVLTPEYGIYMAHITSVSATALTIATTTGLNSNNKFYTNTIANCPAGGISITGYAAATPYTYYDQGNDIGGSTAATGNTISNFGGLAGGSFYITNYAVYGVYQNGANASYNTITQATDGLGGVGIYLYGTNSTFTANGNTISTSGLCYYSSAASYSSEVGIYSNAAGSSLTANNNTISAAYSGVFSGTPSTTYSNVYGINFPGTGTFSASGNNIIVKQAVNSYFYGIYSGALTSVNVSTNTINAQTTAAVTGACYGIYATGTVTGGTTINANNFNNFNINTTGSSYLINASTSTPNVTVTNNAITGTFTRLANSGTFYGYYNFGSPGSGTETISNNNFSNVSIPVASTSTVYIIYAYTASGHTATISGNTFNNWTIGTGSFYGIYSSSVTTGTLSGNTISNITGGGSMYSVYCGGTNSNISSNNINNISSSGSSIYGVYSYASTTANIYKNKIYGLSSTNANPSLYGVYISSGTTSNIYNNLIGDLRTPSANAAIPLAGIYASGGTTVNVYYNTVYLNATSTGALFGSAALYASSTPTLNLRNNILFNSSVPNSTGYTSAYRRSTATLTSYAATSNNNLFYAGAGANNNLFYDGTNSKQTITDLRTFLSPRDAASVTELSVPFLSTTGANANFLHINTTVPTVAEGSGATIATFTDDYDGDIRNVTTPDIGADEFAGIAPTACSGTPTAGAISGSANVCTGQSTILTLSGFSTSSGISVQWSSSATSAGTFTDISGATAVTYNTGVIATGTTVYYKATVTCANGGATTQTTEFSVTSNANPTITVSPTSASICSGGSGVLLTASGSSTYTWLPATGLSTTTGTAVTANPSATTTYTVTGVSAAGCSNTATAIVTVNPAPSAITVTPASATKCPIAPAVLLTTSGGAITGEVALSEYFNSGATGWTTTNTSTGGTAPASAAWTIQTSPYTYAAVVYSSNDASKFYMTNSDVQGSGGTTATTLQSPAFSTVGFTSLNLQFFHYYRAIGDQGFVEVSNNGSTWTAAQTYTATTGSASAFVEANINLNAYIGNANLYIRFRYASAWGYYWALDNVKVTGSKVGDITWTPVTGLFTDAAATTAYVAGTPATTVYALPSATQTYSASVSSAFCTTTGTATVTVSSLVSIAETQVEPTTCVSTDGSINLVLTGAAGPYTFAWTGAGVNPTSQNQTNLIAGAYGVTITPANGCSSSAIYNLAGPGGCSICPTVGSVTTNPTPSGCIGAPITLTASGLISMGITYGITFKSFTAPTADPYTGGTVLATVPNSGLTGGGSTASSSASFASANTYYVYAILSPLPADIACRPSAVTNFIINPTPDASATPTSQTICSGTSITPVVLSGTLGGTTFNWTRNNTVTVTGMAVSGTGNIIGTLTNTTSAPVTVTFTITPFASGCPGTSITTTVLINPSPIAIATPATQTICTANTITTIDLSSLVSGTTYSWTRNNTATATGIAASGSGNISGALTNLTGAQLTVTFTITPTANGCVGVPTTATVIVNPGAIAIATPATQTICSAGSIGPINLTSPITGTIFTWTRDNVATVPGGIAASGSGNSITGFLVNTTNAPVTVTFTITATANGCLVTPTTATVVVNPFASAAATPVAQTTCSGSPISTIALTSNVTGTTYNWTRDNTAGLTGIAASGIGDISGTLINAGTIEGTTIFTITPSFASCPGPTITASVTVGPTPTVNQPANQTLCNGSNTTAVTFTNALVGTTYSWTNNTASIGLAATGTGNIVAFAAANAGVTPVTATITVTPTYNGCIGASKTFTITVNPTANVNAIANQTLCTGATTTAITFVGTITGTTFNWTNSTPSIGLAASGSGNIGAFTAVNTSSTAAVATITVTPTATACVGTAKTFTITVNGQSVAPTGASASNVAVCGSGTADLSVQGGALGTGASWKWYSGSCGGTLIGTGATITGVAVNGTATFYVRAEGTCNTSTCASVTVTVNTQPSITLSASPYTSLTPTSVTGITASISPSLAGNSIVWYKNGSVISGAATTQISNINIDQLGTYTARVTTTAGCTALSVPLVIKDSATSKLYILPNPNNGKFKIRYYSGAQNFGFFRAVTIYDGKGALVYSKEILVTSAYSIMDIDIRNAGKGVFYIAIANYDGIKLTTGRVVVQ